MDQDHSDVHNANNNGDAAENNINNNNNQGNVNDNPNDVGAVNHRARGANSISPLDLHEGILSNSLAVVKLCLENGSDPNVSPLLSTVRTITNNAVDETVRNLHRHISRVFRSRSNGVVRPLHVAVINAYHQCFNSSLSEKDGAFSIVKALIEAGADGNATCVGISLCNVGGGRNRNNTTSMSAISIGSEKTADKLALFLRRFPNSVDPEDCQRMMDRVAACILQARLSRNQQDQEQQRRVSNEATSKRRKVAFSPPPAGLPSPSSSPSETWSKAMTDSNYADLVFQCPDGTVTAHRCILAVAVPYFAAALQGPWKEGTTKTFTTSNSATIMSIVVRFIYTGKIESDLLSDYETAASLLTASSEYQIEGIQDRCEAALIQLISNETIKSNLTLAHLHQREKLQQACYAYVQKNASTVLVEPEIMSLAQALPEVWQDLVAGLASVSNKNAKKDSNSQPNNCRSCGNRKRKRELFAKILKSD